MALSVIVKQQAPKHPRSWLSKVLTHQESSALRNSQNDTYTLPPRSAVSEGKMKTQETKPYTPRKYRLCSYYWSYFLLFTEMFRLAVPSQ